MTREIERWVTWKGRRIPIYRNNPANKPDNFNATVGDKGITIHKDISLEEKQKMVYDFYDKYGVNVNFYGVGYPPGDTLKTILDSVGSQIDEYGKDSFVLEEIAMRSDIQLEETAMAAMTPEGQLQLNPEYFLKTKDELDKIMQECYEDRQFHPKGDASSIIIHEMGHARFNKVLEDMATQYKAPEDEYKATYDLCLAETWTSVTDMDMEDRNGMYMGFINRLDDFRKKMNGSKYIKEVYSGWEMEPDYTLSQLVDPETTERSNGISRYAKKTIHEMMAEAWADYYYNGKNASFMSKQVIQEFLHVYM